MTANPDAATALTPEELVRLIIPPNYRAETAQTGVMPSMDMLLSSRCAGSLRDAIVAAIRQHSEDTEARATKAETLCAEAVRAARLLHFADGDCDPQFGKALAWLSKIAIGNSFTELETRSPAGPLEDATHARERAEGALQAVKNALDTIRRLASVPPVMNSDAAVDG